MIFEIIEIPLVAFSIIMIIPRKTGCIRNVIGSQIMTIDN
jgi:hypothetical protein